MGTGDSEIICAQYILHVRFSFFFERLCKGKTSRALGAWHKNIPKSPLPPWALTHAVTNPFPG